MNRTKELESRSPGREPPEAPGKAERAEERTPGAEEADVTQLLIDWCEGDPEALEQLMPLVYSELLRQARGAMGRERSDHTLQPTALVHETFLQLIDQNRIRWQSRAHFFGVSAQLMRRVMLKYARQHRAAKRGGGVAPEAFSEEAFSQEVQSQDVLVGQRRASELLALDDALTQLEAIDPRQAKIVELRFFGGLTVEEVTTYLEISTATVKRETRMARAWLQRELTEGTLDAL